MSKPSLTKRNEVFNETAETKIVSSRYDLSSRCTGSFRMGALYPIYCRNDIVPGDKFSLSSAPFVRFLPMLAPSLTSVDVEVRYFFVPYRLLWSYWKPFISPNTADQVNLLEPYIPNFTVNSSKAGINVWNVSGSLFDYMGQASVNWSISDSLHGTRNWYNPGGQNYGFGQTAPYKYFLDTVLPSGDHSVYNPIKMSAYPYLAYNFIWNEYFRDENLNNEAPYTISDNTLELGPHNFFIRSVNWQKDYFSSALPFVTQSVYGSAPVVSNGMSIEELREASALTRWLELQAVGGHRYQESILTHFGVRVPDEAAQIPVYLGGGKTPVSINAVDATSAFARTGVPGYDVVLGKQAGRAAAADNIFIDNFEFKEHGVILGLMYVRPTALYADVTPKSLLRKSSRHDYLWPTFTNLGDESIDSNELNPGLVAFDPADFGYTMRYNSYRTSFDQVHGLIRPTESMEYWTQARSWSDYSQGLEGMFENLQVSSDFIRCNPSTRIFTDTTDNDNLVGEIITFVDAVRPLPNYVDPKID